MLKKQAQIKRRPGEKRKAGEKKRRPGDQKKRTTVTAIYNAIGKYPRSSGASVRDIHRFVTKREKGRVQRSLSSIKQAIARAVRRGSIRAPKEWRGFRGINFLARKIKKK